MPMIFNFPFVLKKNGLMVPGRAPARAVKPEQPAEKKKPAK